MSGANNRKGFKKVNTSYTSAGGSRPLPSAAALLAGGSYIGDEFILTDNGQLWVLSATIAGNVPTPSLYQVPGVGTGGLGSPVTVTLALGASITPSHADTSVTANTVLGVTVRQSAPDATATTFSVVNSAGVGWQIKANANAAAAVTIDVWVVKY